MKKLLPIVTNYQEHRHLLIGLFSLCCIAVFFNFVFSIQSDNNLSAISLPLYTGILLASALIAQITAGLLLRLNVIKEGSSFNTQIALALFFMGYLNIYQVFGFLEQGASNLFSLPDFTTMLGGVLLATILLPISTFKNNFTRQYGKTILVIVTIVFSTLVTCGLLLLLFSRPVAATVFLEKWKLPFNIAGGVLLLIASTKLAFNFFRLNRSADLYMSLQCGLIGITSILIAFSTPWTYSWWSLHCLQIAAYAIGLLLFNTVFDLATAFKNNLPALSNKKIIRDSDALLATLNYHAIISIADRAGTITEVNDAFCTISGYSRQELIGRNHRIINSGVQSTEFWKAMWNDISNGISWRGEVCNRTKDGALYWVDTVIAPFVDEDGFIEKYISIRTDITASKLAALRLESALRDSHALQSTLNLHSIISIANRAGNITEVNEAFCKISGYSREELIGRNHRIINSGIQSPEFWTEMWRSISNGKPWRGEVCNRAKDGSLYWVDTVIAPFVDQNGLIEKYISIRTDISSTKKTSLNLEHALRGNEALLSTLNLHAIVSLANRAGNIIEVNDAFCKISGYSRQELIGQNHRIVNSGTHDEQFWTSMWKDISGGVPWRGQVCNRAKNGSIYWVDTFIAPFKDEFGQIEKYISIRTDITPSKLAEDALRWNESLMKMMSNSSPLAFLVVDTRNDKILYFNQRFCTIWGIDYLAEGMQNGSLKYKDVFQSCLNVVASPTNYVESCLELQEQTNRVVVEDEIPFKNDRVVRRFSTQIRDASDVYYGRFYIFEEVTESKRVERALKQASEAALSASQAKSQFLANVSHELRTPMNTVLGMLTLLRKTDLTPKQIDYTDKSDSAAHSLLNLLNAVLDFSKIEAGKMVLDFHAFNLNTIVLNLSDILSGSIGDKPLSIKFHVDPNIPNNLLGDSMRLQQVLINLCSNAIKFTEKGEVIVSIAVVRKTAGDVTLKFSVQDTGIGIAPKHQSTIFKGFMQAEASITRRFGGTGLGLSISQHLVELMGGIIELESNLGQGSMFHFSISLPILKNAESDEPHLLDHGDQHTQWQPSTVENSIVLHQNYQQPSSSETNQDGQRLLDLRILIVEDNLNNQQVAKELLDYEGAIVQIANHGQEAIDAIKQAITPFDLVLMDLQMPIMDGFTATTQIRVNLGMQHLPIVAMTANAMTSDREACLAAGMNNHIGKPFDIEHLVNVILKHTGRRETLKIGSSSKSEHVITNPLLTSAVLERAAEANVDLVSALNRIGNKSDLYLRMLRNFIADINAMPEQFQRQMTASENEALRRSFHALKGSAGTLGANALMDQASLAETQFSDVIAKSKAEAVVNQVCNSITSTSALLSKLLEVLQSRQNEIKLSADNANVVTEKLASDALLIVLRKMAERLKNSDMAAIESMNLLLQNSDDHYVEMLAPIDEAINAMDFEKAFQLCSSLLESLSK